MEDRVKKACFPPGGHDGAVYITLELEEYVCLLLFLFHQTQNLQTGVKRKVTVRTNVPESIDAFDFRALPALPTRLPTVAKRSWMAAVQKAIKPTPGKIVSPCTRAPSHAAFVYGFGRFAFCFERFDR